MEYIIDILHKQFRIKQYIYICIHHVNINILLSKTIHYIPASRFFVTMVASKSGVYPSNRKLPLRMGTSATGMVSFTATDLPNSIPSEAPLMSVFQALLV